MVECKWDPLDRIFHALADPTRRAVLQELTRGGHSVGQLAEPFAMSFAAVTKHIQVLERAGLVRKARHGKFIECQLRDSPFRLAGDWIAQQQKYWEAQLDGLERFMEEDQDPCRRPKKPE